MLRIATFSALLILILVYGRTCASAFSKFVTSFGKDDQPAVVMPKPGAVDRTGAQAGSDGDFEILRLDTMTEAEIKAAIERNRARAAQRDGSGSAAVGNGSAAASSTGSGSAAASSTGSGSAGSAAP